MDTSPAIPFSGPRRGRLNRRIRKAAAMPARSKQVVIYIRASTKDQRLTLEAQEHLARKWAESEGLEVAAVFIEPGVSGTKDFLKRPQGRAAIRFMEQNQVRILMSYTLDRAFRNNLDMLVTLNHLLDRGFTLRLASPDIDFRGAVGRLTASLLAALAEFELVQRSERQIRGFDSMRRDRICRTQNPPYGWDLGAEVDGRFSHSGKPYYHLEPNPAEQEILREMVRRCEHGEAFRSIARDLNERGIPTKNTGRTVRRQGKDVTLSGRWHDVTVKSVIEHAELDDPEDRQPQTEQHTHQAA